jgi:nitroreductase
MDTPEYKLINGYKHIRYHHASYREEEMIKRSNQFYQCMDKRRSVREIDSRPVAKSIIQKLILTASTAPSGAHKQPWAFCAVSDPVLKSKIRKAAEIEEKESYDNRMTERWKEALAPLATDMHKPFLESAPWLIIVFKKVYDFDENGNKVNNYYVNESIGISCGILITAIHHAGLVTLTHTPSPMNFLAKILDRPSNERAYLLLPVGYPKSPVFVPDLERKKLEEVSRFYE